MKTIIIEDEVHQQKMLLDMLKKNFPAVSCVGVAESVEDGICLINSMKPDLVFLDVMLKNKTCFELLAAFNHRWFDIIFTTSYEIYAIKAFRLAAIDYLLKPLELSELAVAVDKVFVKKRNDQSEDHIKLLLSNIKKEPHELPKVALPTLTGFILVEIGDIVRCESDNTYTTLFIRGRKPILISKTLKACEQMLSEFGFLRVHNTSLINTNYIKEYIKGEGGIIIMEDGAEINVSRRKKDEFLRHFSRIRI